jgi:hypothetical protein
MVMDGKNVALKMRIIKRCRSIYRFTGIETFKDDVKDVKGYDCGIQVKDTTTSKKDVIESYHEVAVKRN